jgi:hypothetical protein
MINDLPMTGIYYTRKAGECIAVALQAPKRGQKNATSQKLILSACGQKFLVMSLKFLVIVCLSI